MEGVNEKRALSAPHKGARSAKVLALQGCLPHKGDRTKGRAHKRCATFELNCVKLRLSRGHTSGLSLSPRASRGAASPCNFARSQRVFNPNLVLNVSQYVENKLNTCKPDRFAVAKTRTSEAPQTYAVVSSFEGNLCKFRNLMTIINSPGADGCWHVFCLKFREDIPLLLVVRPLPFNNSWKSENRVSKSRIEFSALASI